MRLAYLLQLLPLLCSCFLPPCQAATKDEAYQLHSFLFSSVNYNKNVRPVSNTSLPVDIFMTFSLMSLVEVDEQSQTLITNARVDLYWDDSFLEWLPTDYGGIESILVKQENLWVPDVIVGNSVQAHQQMGFKELPIRLNYDGQLQWSPSVLVATSCEIVVTYYPFDTQKCSIEYETAVSLVSEVDINIYASDPVETQDFSRDGSWKLIDYQAENLSNEDSKAKIRFTLLLERRTTFYVVNIILPVLFLSLTASLVFALPADAGEKMGTGITVLLAYSVYLTIVSAFLPSTSLQTSVLALYLTILLGYTAFSVVVSVLILRLHHKPETEAVGPKFKEFATFIQRITCKRPDHQYESPKARNTVGPGPNDRGLQDEMKPRRSREGVPARDVSRVSDPPVYEEPMTWQKVAQTLDWFCFLLFTTLTLLTTAVCMLTLVLGGAANRPSIR